MSRDEAARPRAQQRGFAAAAALLALLVASTIASAMAELARLEAVLAHQRRATTAALAAVDACLEEAIASLPAGWDFTALLLGVDATAGTADDGALPLLGGCTGSGRMAPGGPIPPRFLLDLEASRGSGRRRLEAVVRRRADAGVPALVWLADGSGLGRVTGTLTLDGTDAARPLEPPCSTLASQSDPSVLDAWITDQGGTVAISTGTKTPMWAPAPPLAALVARAAAAGASSPGATLTSTPPAAPAITLSAGDLAITGARWGAGLLVVDGVLSIEAPFVFTGVVAATGGLRVEPSGEAQFSGAVWLGGSDELVVEGSAFVGASAAALESADALLPLPRRAVLASVLDF